MRRRRRGSPSPSSWPNKPTLQKAHEPTTPPALSAPTPTQTPSKTLPSSISPPFSSPSAAENLTLAAAALTGRRRTRGRHVEPEGLQDAPVRELPHARHDSGRPAARWQVHGVRPPHEPRHRRLRGVPPPPALQVVQDHRRPRGAPHARPPPPPRRGGRLHDRRGPAAARRVPRQGRRGGGRARGTGSRARRWTRGGHWPAAPGRSGARRPCTGRGRAGPWHDAAPDLAAADAQPLGAAGGVPAGRAPTADAPAAYAAWNATADADAVPTPWCASWSVPWGTAATAVHEGTAADGAATGEAWHAGATTARYEARDAAAAVSAQAWDAAPAAWAAAAWTEPAAVASYLVKLLPVAYMEDSHITRKDHNHIYGRSVDSTVASPFCRIGVIVL